VAAIRAAGYPAVSICLHIPRGAGDTDAARMIELALERIWHVHLSDGRAQRWLDATRLRQQGLSEAEVPARIGVLREHVPLEGQADAGGTADMAAVIRALQAAGHAGWWNHEGPMEGALEHSERRSLASLKAVLEG
jgi:sugar phosphate isomerase/epimerase